MNYYYARNKVPFVARMVAKQLLLLHNDHKIDLNNCIFIGFSLGAHVMGLAARMLKEVVFIPAIVALDPAKPLFSKDRELERLCKLDAKYIEAIHTSTKRLGFQEALWDVDVYVNGGRRQPSCYRGMLGIDWFGKCAHSFAVDTMIMSCNARLLAFRCKDYESMSRNIIMRESLKVGGLNAEVKRGTSGIFLLNINA